MSRRSIGVIIDTMDAQHQSKICEALIWEAEKRDCDLLFFCGVAMEDVHETSAQFETIFNLPNKDAIDGVILVLSFLQGVSGNESIRKLGEKFKDFPLVSIAVPIEDGVSVLVDNTKAMGLVIDHVLTHTEMKNIAYISGPLKSKEAVLRLDAYKNKLKAHNLEFSQDRFYEGDFNQMSGKTAVDYFRGYNEKMPRAIVAANDEMAIGAYLRLQELGYQVPEDVILTGFDNIDSAQAFFPAFTTYDQRPDVMANLAMDSLESLINQRPVEKMIYARGKMVISQSCGCDSNPSESKEEIKSYNSGKELLYDIALSEAKKYTIDNMYLFEKDVIESIAPFVPEKQVYRQLTEVMIKGCFDDLANHIVNGKFISSLNAIINMALINNNLKCNPPRLILRLRERLLKQMNNTVLYRNMQDILFLAESITGDRLRKREVQHQVLFKRMFILSRIMTKALNDAQSIDDMIYIIHHNLSQFGISKCYICLYDRPKKYNIKNPFEFPKYTNLVLGYEKGYTQNVHKFETKHMLPLSIMKEQAYEKLIFFVLFDGQTQYGYVAFSVDSIDAMTYETLRSMISGALKRLEMKKKQKQAEIALNSVLKELEISNELLKHQSVKDELTGLYNRRGFYKSTEHYIDEATMIGEPFAVIFGDIDALKQINDGFGHDEGDFAIRKVASILKNTIGEEAILARMSGDEFTILIKNEDDEEVIMRMISDINEEIDAFNITREKPYRLGISLGYGIYDYRQSKSIDELLKVADVHLYREKQRRKGKVEDLDNLF